LQGFKQRGYLHVQDVKINLKGNILKIYTNLFVQTTRYFLPPNHKFRNHLKNQFDGKIENRGPPKIMGPVDLLMKYEDTELKSWEDFFDRNHSIEEPEQVLVDMLEGMNKDSIFYELSYWKNTLVSHLLDPMHIFKKCLRFYISTYIKTKINTPCLQREIFLFHVPNLIEDICGQTGKNETYVEAPWILKKRELDQLKNVIHSIRTPNGYGSPLDKVFTIDGHITVFKNVRQHRYSNRGRTPSVTTHITRSKINTPMFSRGKTPTGKHPRPQPTRLLGAVY
jgi:hypothetical protein